MPQSAYAHLDAVLEQLGVQLVSSHASALDDFIASREVDQERAELVARLMSELQELATVTDRARVQLDRVERYGPPLDIEEPAEA